MKQRALKAIGALIFWAGWPVLWVYFRIGWRTRLLLIVDGHALVVKGRIGLDKWGLPGGGVHRGEPNDVALLRELKEETGVVLKPSDIRLLAQTTTSSFGLRYRYVSFVAELAKRPQVQISRSFEIAEVAWLPLEELTAQSATADTFETVQTWRKA